MRWKLVAGTILIWASVVGLGCIVNMTDEEQLVFRVGAGYWVSGWAVHWLFSATVDD